MKSPVATEQQPAVDRLMQIKKRVSCLQKKIKKIEDPEGYVQEIVAEKRDKFLNNALARFERRHAQKSEQKEERVAEKKVKKKKEAVCESDPVVVVEEPPLKQMVVEEEEVSRVPISNHSKAISRPPPSLLRRPGTTGPQAPIPSLLSGSRLLK